jgi:hypothetical protein
VVEKMDLQKDGELAVYHLVGDGWSSRRKAW